MAISESQISKIRSLSGSILRYPGGKGRHAKIIASIFRLNGLQPEVFVEPFCGGASISINLLEADIVQSVRLNDLDPLIASLWKTVFSSKDSRWLINQVMEAPLTLEHWDYQKSMEPKSQKEQAFQCLYLNRTSFSGLLHKHAGPIGGRKQLNWTIGCRFDREKIAARIEKLASLSKRVHMVESVTWGEFLGRNITPTCFIYLDPPYYQKAERLYRYIFDQAQHLAMRDYLANFCGVPWVLSYDDSSKIRDMYTSKKKKINGCIIDSTYSTHPIGGNSVIGRELLFTNLKVLPAFQKSGSHSGISVRDFNADSLRYFT